MKINLAVLPGDGIGPEITRVALRAVETLCDRFGHQLHAEYGLCGAAAIDQGGDPYPDATHELCLRSDAVLFGAVGDPRFDHDPAARVRPEQGLLAMRQRLGLYANLRPVTAREALLPLSPLRPERVRGADLLCIRELTGGLYFGRPQGRSEDGNTAYDTCVYTREEITRIVALAYHFALKRRHKLTLVDKANVLATSRLWRQVTQEMALRFPEVETEYLLVDNAAMRLIQSPASFDVLVTENMFGDILTDEASVLTGSMGLLPSASIGLHTSVFEPIHGSWPQAAGKDIANPLAALLSAAMMFDYAFALPAEAALLRRAVEASLEANVRTADIQTPGVAPCGTAEVGEWVSRFVRSAE
ncbi:MAG: 3-isopropylmalate dehydrogenase [Bacteroides sp.]